MRRVFVVLVLIVALVATGSPALAATDPIDSLATSRTRVTTALVGLAEDLDGGRVDLSANGQFVLFDRPGRGVGVYDSVRRQTVVLGQDDARPFAVSDGGGVVLYTSLGQPYRWDRATGQSLALPWTGGLVTDMALSQTGSVVTYTELTGGTSGTMRIWTADLVRTFGATVNPGPGPDDRDVFVNAAGTTVLFRSGSGVRSIDVASGTARFVPLQTLTGLDRAGALQVTARPGNPRFDIGATSSADRSDVNYPGPDDLTLSGVAVAGNGTAVYFHSGDELYRWATTGELRYLQPTGSAIIGNVRDASISGRFLLTSRPGAQRGILEIVDTQGPEIPIIATGTLQGAQLSDQIRRLYLAYFDREPDASGRAGWLTARANGTPLSAVSSAFAGSAEFQQTYGSLSNQEFVELVYANVLGRPGEPAGVAFWVTALNDGTLSRGQVMNGFSEGEEFRLRTGTSQAAMTPVAHQIERLYRSYFLRGADQGGLDFWLEQFASGADLGTLSGEFAVSTEFVNAYGELDNAGFIDRIYENVLGRPGEPDGVAFWLGALNDGTLNRGQVMIGFSESAEFIIRTDTMPPTG